MTTYKLFVLMAVTYLAQSTLTVLWSRGATEALFLLSAGHPWHIWTWVTHIFAHANLIHLAVNMVVLLSFGSVVEERLGSRRFLAFFLVTGVLSGLAQIGGGTLTGASLPGLVGASGALAACVGFLTVESPNLRVLMFFFLPISLWRATGVFAILSVMAVFTGGIGYLGIAHLAHLAGLVLGISFGITCEGS